MNKKGQLAGWEALIIIVLIGYAGYATFLWASKKTEMTVYGRDSKPNVTDTHDTKQPFSEGLFHIQCDNPKVEELNANRYHSN